MTRRLRPPAPLLVHTADDGTPVVVATVGRRRSVTHVAAHWEQPHLWWTGAADTDTGKNADAGADTEMDDGARARADAGGGAGPDGHRVYYTVVLDGRLVWDIFAVQDRWYLERVHN